MKRNSRFLECAETEHGEYCDCLALASAAGVDPAVVTYRFCKLVLQKRWGMRCNHGHKVKGKQVTPLLPARDPFDAVQAILVANALTTKD